MPINEAILKLREHPDVKEKLDAGLSGKTFIDHFIGVVEEALHEKEEDPVLKKGYEALQREYPLYFARGSFALNIVINVPYPKIGGEEEKYGAE